MLLSALLSALLEDVDCRNVAEAPRVGCRPGS